MKIRSAIMLSGALALMLVSGCQSSPEPESAPTPAAGQSGTVEASEPEYSADLELCTPAPTTELHGQLEKKPSAITIWQLSLP